MNQPTSPANAGPAQACVISAGGVLGAARSWGRSEPSGRCVRGRAALAAALLVVLPWAGMPLHAQVRLPAMGESVSASMPLSAERRLGDQIWVEIRRDPAYLDDPVLAEYLTRLWQPLLQAAARRGEIGDDMRAQFAWDAFLIRDRSINAFALPGGYIGVHLGLIAGTSSRDELVSVLAHELVHVTQRHIARSMESAGRQSALGIAAILLGLIAASRSSNPDVAQAAIASGQAAMIQGQLNFSRDMEREADRIGQGLMTDAGFQSAGMSSMFDKLDKANRLSDAGAFPYLRSHPLTVERIAEAQSRAGITRALPVTDDAEHALMRARAQVLMDPTVQALRGYVEAMRAWPASATAPAGTLYAGILAGVQLKDEAVVRQGLSRWTAAGGDVGPQARWMALLAAEAALALGPAAKNAWPARPPAGPADAWPRPELVLWGRSLLARRDALKPDEAAFKELHQTLRLRLVREPRDATLWEMLAACESAIGHRLASLRATAESHLWSGNAQAAMITLRSARRLVGTGRDADAVELAVIDARLAELTRQQRALREEREGRQGRGGREGREGRDDPDAREPPG